MIEDIKKYFVNENLIIGLTALVVGSSCITSNKTKTNNIQSEQIRDPYWIPNIEKKEGQYISISCVDDPKKKNQAIKIAKNNILVKHFGYKTLSLEEAIDSWCDIDPRVNNLISLKQCQNQIKKDHSNGIVVKMVTGRLKYANIKTQTRFKGDKIITCIKYTVNVDNLIRTD